MTKIVEVAAAILLRQSATGTEYLLAQRPEGKVLRRLLGSFLAAKVEVGETLRDALIREIEEELGVTVDRTLPVAFMPIHLPARHGKAEVLPGHRGTVKLRRSNTAALSGSGSATWRQYRPYFQPTAQFCAHSNCHRFTQSPTPVRTAAT